VTPALSVTRFHHLMAPLAAPSGVVALGPLFRRQLLFSSRSSLLGPMSLTVLSLVPLSGEAIVYCHPSRGLETLSPAVFSGLDPLNPFTTGHHITLF